MSAHALAHADTRQQRQLAELLRDACLRVVPAGVLGLHVRPELRYRGHGQHAPLRAFGAHAPDPGRGLLHELAEIHATPPQEHVVADARDPFPAAVAAILSLAPPASDDIRRRRRVALEAAERLVVDPCLRERVELARTRREVAGLQ